MASGRNSVTVKADLAGLDALLDGLGDSVDEAVRPAAQAGAQILYEAVKQNVAGIKRKTGSLAESIYQAYSESNSNQHKAEYHVSWNSAKAPHGWLVENGHLQRYRYYQGNDGQIRPMVRPGMDGTKKPKRRASQAVKDAYYVTLPVPIQVPGKAFVRRAIDQFPQAEAAVRAELLRRINGGEA